jgi:hypothetical protein
VTRPDPLAAHVRRLGNQDLKELLVQLAEPTFAALVEVALARPTLPAGLLLHSSLHVQRSPVIEWADHLHPAFGLRRLSAR